MNSSGPNTLCLILVLALNSSAECFCAALGQLEAMTPWRHVGCVSWDGKAISPFLSFIQENTVGYGHQRQSKRPNNRLGSEPFP